MKIQNKNCGSTGEDLTKGEHTLNKTKNPTHKQYYSKTQNMQNTSPTYCQHPLHPHQKGGGGHDSQSQSSTHDEH